MDPKDRGDGVLSRPGPHLVFFFVAPAIFKYTYERTVQFQVCFRVSDGWILRLRLQRPYINVSAFDILLLLLLFKV